MIAISPSAESQTWESLSFVSTLYLQPVLELLLRPVPSPWQAEVRLGLQEALVNAAKHGNDLDPAKQIVVKYTASSTELWWVITDQGEGFHHPCGCDETSSDDCGTHPGECGRGLYILYKVFDEVAWRRGGRELHLGKVVRQAQRLPLIR